MMFAIEQLPRLLQPEVRIEVVEEVALLVAAVVVEVVRSKLRQLHPPLPFPLQLLMLRWQLPLPMIMKSYRQRKLLLLSIIVSA